MMVLKLVTVGMVPPAFVHAITMILTRYILDYMGDAQARSTN